MYFGVDWSDVGLSVLVFKGVVGSQRRVTVPKIYVLTYELWEGEVLSVNLHNRQSYRECTFLARIQRGFRFQIPKVEFEDLKLREGSLVEAHVRKAENEKAEDEEEEEDSNSSLED